MAVASAPPSDIKIQTAKAFVSSGTQASARLLGVGVSLLVGALIAFVALQYAMPEHYRATVFGTDMMGVWHFADHLGITAIHPLSVAHFCFCFRLLLCLLWTGYALAVVAGLRGAAISPRPLTALIIMVGAAMAVLCPPLLSADMYAYLGHGRLYALYGQNPYVATPQFLFDVHDPISHFLFWNSPTVYGPVWTRMEIAAVSLLRHTSLWPQVVALKLIAAAALAVAAFAGRRITFILSPGRENLTLLAIGLNPFLLIEGPGNGHNDLLLVALLLVGAMFLLEKKYLPAAVFLGLSVGIKMITLAALPWMILEAARNLPWRRKIGMGLAMAALALLPTMICYVGLWAGMATVEAMEKRAAWGLSVSALAVRHGLIAAAYLALSVWVWRARKFGAWLTAWSLLAAVIMFAAFTLSFPWYICWFWTVCLTRWDRASLILTAACGGMGLVWDWQYAALIPLPAP